MCIRDRSCTEEAVDSGNDVTDLEISEPEGKPTVNSDRKKRRRKFKKIFSVDVSQKSLKEYVESEDGVSIDIPPDVLKKAQRKNIYLVVSPIFAED